MDSELVRTVGHLLAAYLLTVILGWQSEREVHSAGIRTFPIVGMASCGYLLLVPPATDLSAASRLLQGLITGIGFIGGGAILKQDNSVRGTAIAASIWCAAVIGAAVALDRWSIAVTLALLNLLTMRALLPIKRRLDSNTSDTH